METSDDFVASLLIGCAYFINVLYLAAAVVAFVRLRVSAAGMLVGGGLFVMSFCGLGVKIFRSFVLEARMRDLDSADFETVMTQMQAASYASTCTSTICWVAVAIGVAMIPRAFPPPGSGQHTA